MAPHYRECHKGPRGECHKGPRGGQLAAQNSTSQKHQQDVNVTTDTMWAMQELSVELPACTLHCQGG